MYNSSLEVAISTMIVYGYSIIEDESVGGGLTTNTNNTNNAAAAANTTADGTDDTDLSAMQKRVEVSATRK